MNRFFRFLPDLLLRGRLLVLAALFAATGYLGSRIPDIETNFATERMFHVEDSRRLDYERAAGIFGKDDNLLLILLEVPEPAADDSEAPRDIFDQRVIDEIARLGAAIGEIDGVTRVIDVADAVEMYGTDGGFRVGRLIEEVPEDPEALAALKRRVLTHRLHARRLVSEDGRLAAMLVEIDAERFPLDQDRYAVVVDVQRLLGMDTGAIAASVYPKDREPPEAIPPSPLLRASMTGIPALRYAYLDLIESDQKRFLPFVVGMMLLVSAFLFRSLQGVVLPFAMVTVSLTWAMGWFPILGKPIDLISTILPTLLVVYGVADSIHLIGRYHELYAETGDKIGSLKRTIHDLGVACFLTSLTTAVGFGSLYISKMQIIRDFGLLAAVGVMGAYVVTIFLLPIALYYWKPPARLARRKAEDGLAHRMLAALADFDIRHAKAILFASVAILAVSIYGVTKAEVVTRILEDIDPGHPAAGATRVADARLGGILPLTILFEGPPEAFKEPENLRRVADVQAFMKSLPETGTASSIADMVGLMNEAVAPEGAEGFRIPDLRATVAEFLFLFSLSGDERDILRFANEDFSAARIVATAADVGSIRLLAWKQKVIDHLAEMDLGTLRATVTGDSLVASGAMTRLVNDMISSFLSAFVIIFFILAIEFRSIPLGALSMLPNILPTLLVMGLLGLLHEPIRASTAVIFAIAIGIAVDDTIHYFVRFAKEMHVDHDHEASARRAMVSSGRAILFTTLLLTLGMGVLSFSDFVATRNFGILTGVTLATALVADLVVAPALLVVFRPRIPKSLEEEVGE